MSSYYLPMEDGTNLRWQHDKNGSDVVVIIVHGLCEHQGRYEGIRTRLREAGYDTFSYDHRGHGRSEGKAIYFRAATDLAKDLFEVFEYVKGLGYRKVYLLGHSMGGFTALQFGVLYPKHVDGIIASAAPSFNYNKNLKPLPKFLPGKIKVPGRLTGLHPSELTRDEDVVQAYIKDPLVKDFVTVGLARALYDGLLVIQYKIKDFTDPVLLLHGEGDLVVSYKDSQEFYARCPSEDKRLILYPELYHEILNEPEKARVEQDILEWLEERRD